MPLRALLFDLDGTLADTDSLHVVAWKEALASHGLAIDDEFYRRRISGRHNPEIVADLLPHLAGDERTRFASDKEARFREMAHRLDPVPGLHALLDWASGHWLRMALVTNAPRENVSALLRILGVEHAFDPVILGEDLSLAKPDPMPYRVALDELAISAGDAIAFEDSPSGVRSAVGAGIATVGITTGHDPSKLLGLGAALVVDDFTSEELWKLLESA